MQKGAAEGRQEEEEAAPVALKKGQWTAVEDAMLKDYIQQHGEGNWNAVQRMTGLQRCGKSCRLRWNNHLRPNLKKSYFSPDEEIIVTQLHAQLGNKWACMAAYLPGRTDNDIKNYWNTRTRRCQRAGLPVYPPEVQLHLALAKRPRHDDELSPLAPPQLSETSVQMLETGGAASAAHQLAMATSQTMQILSPPPPISGPSSPWTKPFARNAHSFQFAHSSPVSLSTPTGPPHPVMPDLSVGYGQSGLSPSPGPRIDLSSIQFCQALMMPQSPASTADGCLGGGEGPPDQTNATRLEKIMQELHEAINVDLPVLAPGDAVLEQHDGKEDKPEGELKDDIDTLFDLMTPAFNTVEPAPPAPAPNHSSSIPQHSSDDQDPSNVDLGLDHLVFDNDDVDHLPAAVVASLADQEWSLDGFGQWSNASRIW